MAKLMPELSKTDIQQLVEAGLENEFILHHLTKKDILFPKEEKAYLIKKGSALAYGYTDEGLEFHMKFQKGDGIGLLNVFIEDNLDFILRGMNECVVLEIPIKKSLQSTNIKFILSVYEEILTTMSGNLFKILKDYAAKINYSNEQYLLNFIMAKGGFYQFSTTEDLAHLLHIDLRTLQRIIKKLSESGTIIKKKNTIKILDHGIVQKK